MPRHVNSCGWFHQLLIIALDPIATLVNEPIALGGLEIGCNHFCDQFAKCYFRFPSQLCPSLAGVSNQRLDLSRPKIARVNGNPAAASAVESFLLQASAAPG